MADSEPHSEESCNSIPTPIPAAASIDCLSGLTSAGSADSYRPIHSLLLCPAQWSALLESPISIVRGRGEDEFGQPQDGLEKLEDGTAEERLALASSEVAGERSLPSDCCCEDAPSAINVTAVPRDVQPLAEPNGRTDSRNGSSQEALVTTSITTDEGRHQDCPVPVRLSTRGQSPLPGQLSGSSQGSSITTCTSPLQQLEEEEEAEHSDEEKKTMSQTLAVGGGGGSNRSSLRQPPHSAPNTPLSESKQLPSHSGLPPAHPILPHFPSHARNISETPSLPPFISSSTSSAYHSRNSSLASQITSECFDSDNQSQFTDIDSCIVLHGGGAQGDFHRPISLQDSRFKFPEGGMSLDQIQASQMQCFSVSDFNLNQQFSFLPSPNLEETIQSGSGRTGADTGGGACGSASTSPNETIQEKLQASGVKSSEWIKREMTRASESLVHVKISSKTKHVVHYNVRAGDTIIWEFATKKKDIGFGVMFENTEVVIEESATEEEEAEDEDVAEKSPEEKVIPILPHLRVNAHTRPCIGSHTAKQDGIYEIVFENTYSRFFAKELFYRITTQPSQPNDNQNYLKQ